MVGYKRHDVMTQSEKFVAGVVSGVMTRAVTQPMDVIKIRAQLLRKAKQSAVVLRVAKTIYKEEGIKAFWNGHCLGQLHSILAVSSQFYVYELCTRFVAMSGLVPKPYLPISNFICGTIAGCVCTALVIPLEVIRVRQIMMKDQYKSFYQGAKWVYRYGGVLAFYEGLNASLLQMGPQVGISFTVFSLLQPFILHLFSKCPPEECHRNIGNKHKPHHLALASSIAGCAAGFISKTLTYPMDLVKRRLQIGSHQTSKRYYIPTQSRHLLKCTKLVQCLYLAYKNEGFKGLFRGWTVTVYKAQLTSIVAFTTYELTCYIMRELDAVPREVPPDSHD